MHCCRSHYKERQQHNSAWHLHLLGEPGCVAWLAAPAALKAERPDGPAVGNKGFIEADAPAHGHTPVIDRQGDIWETHQLTQP